MERLIALKSLHKKILESSLAEKVTEEEMLCLAKLEDKLESGQLVELPCKVGDTVFVLRNGAGSPLRIEEDKIIGFDILQNTIVAHGKYGHAYSEVFLTKLEVEARLKELQE